MREEGQGTADNGEMVQAGFTIWQEPQPDDAGRGEAGGEHEEREGQAPQKRKKEPDGGKEPPIPANMDDFRSLVKSELALGESFDVVMREMTFGGRRTALVFMNGFGKDYILTDVLKRLSYLDPSQMSSHALHDFFHLYVPAIQVSKEPNADKLLDGVLSGSTAFYIEHETTALLIDAKNFPSRQPEEPSLERVVRGSRDGFVETLMVNITLVRRRLRDTSLRYKLMRVGRRTKTDICVAYLDDVTDKSIVDKVVNSIKPLDVDGLPMADTQLSESMVKKGWNPYPLARYSERPDVVASHLLDGSVAVFVDTSPSVMLVPTTLFDLVQHAEESRQTPLIGTYLRWVRFIGIFLSVYLLPLWFLYVIKPELLPANLSFIGPTHEGRLPIILQFLLAEIGIDLMRMAAVHTPTPLATAMSLVSAILIGDIAVSTGLFINEVILYIAVAAIGMFATPSYELALANRIVRLILLVAVALFHEIGFMVVATFLLIYLARERSYTRPYLWPFIPFEPGALLSVLVRKPFLTNRMRPNVLSTQDRDRHPEAGADAKNANDE